jgi:3-oxoacyl-[acyl-carrier protein] reductase
MNTSPTGVIFGASGGMGSALARRLAAKGWKLILAGRSAEKLQPLASELNAIACVTDVTDPAQVQQAIQAAVDQTGRVEGVANCVGSIVLKPVHLLSDADWMQTIQLNLSSAFYVLRAAIPAMTSGGSIVLVSSVAARIGLMNHEAIAAAKAGVIGLTLSAAATYANRNIRVNCVAPGLVRTPLTTRFTSNEATLKASQAMHPLGRIGEPDEIASAMEWFLDPANSWVTGQVLSLDGGMSSVKPRS